MVSTFNFADVVLAQGGIEARPDRQWALMIACGAQSSIRHGTITQPAPIGRISPLDLQVGIRTSDDLLALAEVIEELRTMIATKVNEIFSSPSAEPLSPDPLESE